MTFKLLSKVAPRVGAWIETRLSQYFLTSEGSPLAWGRGLKHHQSENQETQKTSPLAWGRGLKLFFLLVLVLMVIVAPRVGAWIETQLIVILSLALLSPLAWGRGLKR